MTGLASSPHPLAFRVRDGRAPAVLGAGDASDLFTVEARFLDGHQKEALVEEGAGGPVWRLVSDEGGHLKGSDLAPFPLGFFNAGLAADLLGRLHAAGAGGLTAEMVTTYAMTGSFFRGDGVGEAGSPEGTVSGLSPTSADALLAGAAAASPALALCRAPLPNSFALTVNGRRRSLAAVPEAAFDAPDPFRSHSADPAPLAGADDLPDLIRKTGARRPGEIAPAGAGGGRTTRAVHGLAAERAPGVFAVETALGLPGMSWFAITADERAGARQAPCGLALLAAGIAFCFMTQLSRYVEHMGLDVRRIRLVQRQRFGRAEGRGTAGPAETHLFADGADAAAENLVMIAARTCYLHATMAAPLAPVLRASDGR